MRVRGSARSSGRACDRARVHGKAWATGHARLRASGRGYPWGAGRMARPARERTGTLLGIRYGLRLWMGCAWHAGLVALMVNLIVAVMPSS